MCHSIMGKHKEWRKLAKKSRRKLIRAKKAKERDEKIAKAEQSPRFIAWLLQQEAADEALAVQEEEALERRELQWLEDELKAQQLFRIRQLEKAKHDEQVAKQKAQLKAEIAAREAKKKADKEAQEAKQKQLEQEAREREQKIEDFLNQGCELPAELRIASESNPSKPACPFFSKVAACRFSDQCSRNHIRPAISKCILFCGMFSHPSLGAFDRSAGDQQDWDLEFAEGEIRTAFLEFYEDVSTELASQGELVRFVVTSNAEPHLRGNVYAQFASERDALKVCRSFVGRWFAGRRLQPIFVSIPSWKAAICGLYDRGRCPKGRNCNFLHIFHNPGGQLSRTPPKPQPSRRESSSRRRAQRSRSRSISPWQHTSRQRSPSSWSARSRRKSRSPTPRNALRAHSRSLSPWGPEEPSSPLHRRSAKRKKCRGRSPLEYAERRCSSDKRNKVDSSDKYLKGSIKNSDRINKSSRKKEQPRLKPSVVS